MMSALLLDVFCPAAEERAAQMKVKRARKHLLSGITPAGDEVRLLYDLAEQQVLHLLCSWPMLVSSVSPSMYCCFMYCSFMYRLLDCLFG
jgi:hypothetical protein